jgi:hypothetical protein
LSPPLAPLCLISSAKKATAVASSVRGATGGSCRRHFPPRPLQQSSSTPSSSSATPSCRRHRPPIEVVPALAVAEGDISCVVMGGSAPPSPPMARSGWNGAGRATSRHWTNATTTTTPYASTGTRVVRCWCLVMTKWIIEWSVGLPSLGGD